MKTIIAAGMIMLALISVTIALANGEPDANGDLHSQCHTGSKGRGAGGNDKGEPCEDATALATTTAEAGATNTAVVGVGATATLARSGGASSTSTVPIMTPTAVLGVSRRSVDVPPIIVPANAARRPAALPSAGDGTCARGC